MREVQNGLDDEEEADDAFQGIESSDEDDEEFKWW